MFATFIVPEASSEAYGSQQELNPILAASKPVPGENRQKESTPSMQDARLEAFPSWEYFLNELEFE